MAHKVTPEQYARQHDALHNWPGRLPQSLTNLAKESYFAYDESSAGCVLDYLRIRAGLSTTGGPEMSRYYGIPTDTLTNWSLVNDWVYLFFLFPRRRARGMKRRFEEFHKNCVVVAPPLSETIDAASLKEELYEAHV